MNSIANYRINFNIHKKSVVINTQYNNIVRSKDTGKGRSAIKSFSYKTERRMRLQLEDMIENLSWFNVLTYPENFPVDGRIVKKHNHALIQWLKRQGVNDYFWGIEFQKRGAVHINVLTDIELNKEKLSRAWFKIVRSGDPKHLRAGTRIEMIRDKNEVTTYLVGYCHKKEQKEVPAEFINIGRFWGCNRKIDPKGIYTFNFRSWSQLQSFILPITQYYEGKMNEWSKKKEKAYTWQYRGVGFVMWDGKDFIENYINEVVANTQNLALSEEAGEDRELNDEAKRMVG